MHEIVFIKNILILYYNSDNNNQYVFFITQCDEKASLDAFMERFRGDSQPTYVSLLCCGCSAATIPVALVSHYWNIPQVFIFTGTSVNQAPQPTVVLSQLWD